MNEIQKRTDLIAVSRSEASFDAGPLHGLISEDIALADCVTRALNHHIGIEVDDIYTQDNVAKYFDSEQPLVANQELTEVFELMRGLNEGALASPLLCQTKGAGNSFLDALAMAVDQIAEQFRGRMIHYVELGPEPVKTSFILKRLLAAGVNIHSYVGVDINPASEPLMKRELSKILSPHKIESRTLPFSEFRADDIRVHNTPCVITMLGFQEGNESPQTMLSWLSRIASSNDVMLSEMQLMPVYGSNPIAQFYQNPNMKRFSEIAFTRIFGDRKANERTFILPVTIAGGEKIEAAIMCHEYFDRAGKMKLFVANYCLKYTRSQMRYYREVDDRFEVVFESLTEDETVVFQISKRQ